MRNNQAQEIIHHQYEYGTMIPRLMYNPTITDLFVHPTLPVLDLSTQEVLNEGAKIGKRCFDIAFSLAVLIIGMPIFLLLSLITKVTSKGPVFYKQNRIGLNQTSFDIYKYRSMFTDAEKDGPALSQDDQDPRITKWGRMMRKTRLDELPQFWNVLKGDMSVVGPRPERMHFIQQITAKDPNYKKLLRIKPGITSIGQVKYGYAQNVDEMCERMIIDLEYLKGINLWTDLNIIFKTVKVVVMAKGK